MWEGFEITGFNDASVKDICYNCGSPMGKKSYNYFRKMFHVSGYTIWCKVWSKDGKPAAFYFASRCRDHVRLVEIAVHKDFQGQGFGRKVLYDLLSSMERVGLYKLTFRTPISEDAQNFWLHMGAKIMDVKGDDYEMEINIKQK